MSRKSQTPKAYAWKNKGKIRKEKKGAARLQQQQQQQQNKHPVSLVSLSLVRPPLVTVSTATSCPTLPQNTLPASHIPIDSSVFYTFKQPSFHLSNLNGQQSPHVPLFWIFLPPKPWFSVALGSSGPTTRHFQVSFSCATGRLQNAVHQNLLKNLDWGVCMSVSAGV